MLCCHCNNNQATKTYEQIKNGKSVTEYYCLECYHRLFLVADEAEGEMSLSACPYCGTTVEEAQSTKLVGCAYCYRTLQQALTPTIVKMQGVEIHKGKRPPAENLETSSETAEQDPTEIEKARYARQCRELTFIIEKLKSEHNFKDAKGYADKLSRMRSKLKIEEDFVWRGSTKVPKRS